MVFLGALVRVRFSVGGVIEAVCTSTVFMVVLEVQLLLELASVVGAMLLQ